MSWRESQFLRKWKIRIFAIILWINASIVGWCNRRISIHRLRGMRFVKFEKHEHPAETLGIYNMIWQ